LDTLPPGQVAAIITTTANTLQLGMSEKLCQLFSGLSTVIACLIVAITYNWLLTLVTSMGLIFITIVYKITAPSIASIMTNVMEADIQAASIATEAFMSIKMLAACGAELKMAKKYERMVDEGRRRGHGMSWLVGIQQGLGEFHEVI
jgi:ATP-binding cassette, subfamily B (MDR/TAP), member 1